MHSFFLPACTPKVQPALDWRSLANPEIKEVKAEAARMMVSGAYLLEGKAASGLVVRVAEHGKEAGSFEKHFEKMGLLLDNLYQPHGSPYPGQVTKTIACPAELMPRALPAKIEAAMRSRGFLLMANSREVFGACDAGSVHYQAAYVLVGCKEQNVTYEIKLFLLAGSDAARELERVYDHFSCK